MNKTRIAVNQNFSSSLDNYSHRHAIQNLIETNNSEIHHESRKWLTDPFKENKDYPNYQWLSKISKQEKADEPVDEEEDNDPVKNEEISENFIQK